MFELTNGKTKLFQWDKGVKVSIDAENVNEVHFANLSYGTSRNVEVLNGFAEIPPEVLQSGADVYCWLYVRSNEQGYTKLEHKFNVVKRPKPADYVYEPTEILSWKELDTKKLDKKDVITNNVDIGETYGDEQVYNANSINKAFEEVANFLEDLQGDIDDISMLVGGE